MSPTPIPGLGLGRFDIECALVTEDYAGIVVDCVGGQGADEDGRAVDAVLELLTQVGFVKVTETEESATPKFPQLPAAALTARLDGDRLTVSAGEVVIIEDARVSFLPHWYRVARRGVLIAMFGRNLQGMSWEDPGYIRRAAQKGKLVGAAMQLTVAPPGRNSQCVCTPRTHQKYKRCCGRPVASPRVG